MRARAAQYINRSDIVVGNTAGLSGSGLDAQNFETILVREAPTRADPY